MTTKYFPAAGRGQTDVGWAQMTAIFSMGGFYDPNRMGWGQFRVFDHTRIRPGGGFPTHPHEDMEIVTFGHAGQLQHRDSTGGEGIIRQDDAQYMSAGTGVQHSEVNPGETEDADVFQLWIFPDKRGYAPRYQHQHFPAAARTDQWQFVAVPEGAAEPADAIRLRQQAYIARYLSTQDAELTYPLHGAEQVVFVYVKHGRLTIGEHVLTEGDGLGLAKLSSFTGHIAADTELLAVESPAGIE